MECDGCWTSTDTCCHVLQAEALYQQFRAKKEQLQGKSKEQVLSKYGSAAKAPEEEVALLAPSEAYVEYNAQVLFPPTVANLLVV